MGIVHFILSTIVLTNLIYIVSSSSSLPKTTSTPSSLSHRNPVSLLTWNYIQPTECNIQQLQLKHNEAPKSLNCVRGGCGYRDCLIPVHCNGGGCLFDNVEHATCDGGGCKFINSNYITCNGGGCDFSNPRNLLIKNFCNGGGCTIDGYSIPHNIEVLPACKYHKIYYKSIIT